MADAMIAHDAFAAHAAALARRSLASLFGQDPKRVQALTLRAGPLTLDQSKLHVDERLLALGAQLLESGGALKARQDMLEGRIANATEQRAVLHTALRASRPIGATISGQPVATPVLAARSAMQAMTQRLRADASIRGIVHVGIGGSVLGPQLVLDALSRPSGRRFDVRFLANIDGEAFERAVDGLDPKATLLLIASKSWTTLETRRNADAVTRWLERGGASLDGRRIAITARPELARAEGYGEEAILPFADWVGGRFSLWSGIGLPVALALGWDVFADLLAGAEAMDRHFADTPAGANLPVAAALCAFAYTLRRRPPTRAVFAYDQRLALLVPYLQQLEMESLGKGVSVSGQALRHGAPVVWGGVGTDQQHAVFQWLHHAVDQAVTEFVLVRASLGDDDHHRSLIANALAQGSALAMGLSQGAVLSALRRQGLDEAAAKALAPHKTFPGNRPSALLVADDLGTRSLGWLIAHYEHRAAVLGWLLGLNPFDQWGVELGKVIAGKVEAALDKGAPADGLDPSTLAWIDRLRR